MESLLYMQGLSKAAELAEYIGRNSVAEEYRNRAAAIGEAILRHCSGTVKNDSGEIVRLIQDGPGVEEYSVHCQVFAIINGLVSQKEGLKMLDTTMGYSNTYAQCSVAMQFYLFRALEIVGAYEKTNELWNLWRNMVNDHMTTCVENDTDARSDCHAWASLILYELPSVSLGIRPAAPGYRKAVVSPVPGYMTYCEGDVATPYGMIHVEWKQQEDGEYQMFYSIPDEIQIDSTEVMS